MAMSHLSKPKKKSRAKTSTRGKTLRDRSKT